MRSLLRLFIMVLLIAGCGKKGALIYPDMLLPAMPSNITVGQVGPSIKLAFILPDKDKAGQALTDLAGVKVFRREALAGQAADCSSCANDFRAFKTIYADHMDSSTQRYGSLFVLLDSDVRIGREYAYKVIAFTKGNVDGEASKAVQTALVQVLLPPALKAISAPTEILLEFVGLSPIEGTLAGFNLYRWVKGDILPFIPINKLPLVNNSFTDTGLERGITYVYAARMVVRMPKGELLESALSKEAEAWLRDDE